MCEDFPCCGHERGDCEGKLYGTDAAIQRDYLRRLDVDPDGYYDTDY